MSFERKIIRRAAKAALLNRTNAEGRVHQSRSAGLWDKKLPAICVYCAREVITLENEAARQYRRELEIRFEAGAEGKTDEDVDDQLDDLGRQIEQCVGRSNRLTFGKQPSVAELWLSGASLDISKDGNKVVGGLVLTYTAVYYTFEPDCQDSEPIDDLKTVGTEYNLNKQQATPERASNLIKVDNS